MEVESPVKEVEALHVSVGVSVVWVVTKDYKVSLSTSNVLNSDQLLLLHICVFVFYVFQGVVQAWCELPQPLWLRLDQHRRGDDDGGCWTQ